ncbi:hypothetical protein OPT61_g4409 [Boeremia exigua]|uniref:Uncharacterized protein n=1 Tax=Boeremia exigua TaxID=749465 RepID=A0ACC2IEC3_9PLEO|nr:hypothetical protein OPT61_g4409 [Boeremia exigua]
MPFSRLFSGQWNADQEQRKVTMLEHRPLAVVYSLLHLIPLTVASILLVLRWTSHWVSYIDSYSTALQFAAKLRELTMQASLTEVLLCIIRAGLVNDVVPLGALSSSMQASQLSYLWSLDFFSIFKSNAFRGRQKVLLAVAIPVLISLASVVGPSSAVLLIPRPYSPQVDAKNSVIRYSNISIADLYPSQMHSDDWNVEFPTTNASLQYSYVTESETVQRRVGTISHVSRVYRDFITPFSRIIRATHDPAEDFNATALTDGISRSNATIPTRYITNAFNHMDSAGNESPGLPELINSTITVTAAHPVVGTQCWRKNSLKLDGSSELEYLQDDWVSKGKLSQISAMLEVDSNTTNLNQTSQDQDVQFSSIWTKSPQPDSKSCIALFITWYTQGIGNESTRTQRSQTLAQALEDSGTTFDITTCTVNAFWRTDEMELIFTGGSAFVQTPPLSTNKKLGDRPIAINLENVHTLQDTTFNHLLDMHERTRNNVLDGVVPRILGRGLVVILANGKEYPSYFNSGPIFQTSPEKNGTEFEFTTTNYGYGYGTSYVLYTIITGYVSTAWSSGIELVTLALQSKKPEHLGHTSVGIGSIKTLREGVGVRVNTDNELELVFGNDNVVYKRVGHTSESDTPPTSRNAITSYYYSSTLTYSTIREEEVIVQYILNLDARGFAPTYAAVRDMADRLLAARGAGQVGVYWARNFVKRTDSLKMRFNRAYDRQRALCEDPILIRSWFELVEQTKAKYGICDDDVWNSDEAGFMMGKIKTQLVVTGLERRGWPKALQPGNCEWATLIAGINAGGWSIPLFLILTGQYHLSAWYEDAVIPRNWVIAVSDNGWTTNKLGVEWLKHFNAHTEARTVGACCLLILDGHESYNSLEF